MRGRLAELGNMVANLYLFAVRSGQWWFPIVLVVLAVGTLAVLSVATAVPTAVYTFI